MPDNSEAMARVGHMLNVLLLNIAGHQCDFVLAAFPDGQADWIVSHTEPEPHAMIALYKLWLARFVEDGPKERVAEPDEVAVSMAMRDIAKLIESLLEGLTGHKRFALVVFPRNLGMYCANISRESAKLVMTELMTRVDRTQ